MSELTIEVLKKIIEHMPENYTVEFSNGDDTVKISDKLEIDVGSEKIILKKF